MPDIKLGSLFDGIGVFPLAASRCGIRPVWASEIEKAPISITKRHFPDMVHLGDITKVDGGKIPPVHVITFGSPCQNLSLIFKQNWLPVRDRDMNAGRRYLTLSRWPPLLPIYRTIT